MEDPGRRKRKAFLFDDEVCCLEKTERRKTVLVLESAGTVVEQDENVDPVVKIPGRSAVR